jgi:hypothetical protein
MSTVPSFKDRWDRGWYGPFPFTSEGVAMHAPSKSGVYQIRDPAGVVVYIGIATKSELAPGEGRGGWETEGTTSVQKRLRAHVRGGGNKAIARLRAVGKLQGFTFVYHLCDGESASQIESFVLVHHRPGFNGKTEWACLPPSIAYH